MSNTSLARFLLWSTSSTLPSKSTFSRFTLLWFVFTELTPHFLDTGAMFTEGGGIRGTFETWDRRLS